MQFRSYQSESISFHYFQFFNSVQFISMFVLFSICFDLFIGFSFKEFVLVVQISALGPYFPPEPVAQSIRVSLRIRRYGVRSPLGPKQSEAIFSVHLNRRLFWWFRVVGSLLLHQPVSLVSVYCDQPPLIRFGVCGRKAITKPKILLPNFSRWFIFVCQITNGGCGRLFLIVTSQLGRIMFA
jgi:hypothetical protein